MQMGEGTPVPVPILPLAVMSTLLGASRPEFSEGGANAGCASLQQIWGGRVPESPGRQERPGQPAVILP